MVSFIIAACFNVFICIVLLLHGKNYLGLVIFIILNITIKVIPIILLIGEPIHFWINLLTGIGVFIVYNFYLYLKNTNILQIYDATIDSITNGKNNTPMFYLLHKIMETFSR
jgi:hypothetical protein